MPINKSSISRVKVNLGKKISNITGPQTDVAINLILRQGSNAALDYTPVDTRFLANSLTPPQVANGKGTVAFTAKYAAAVHAKSGKLKGKPRTPHRNGTSRGNYWDLTGEPKFLEKGFEEIKPSIPAIVKLAYKG